MCPRSPPPRRSRHQVANEPDRRAPSRRRQAGTKKSSLSNSLVLYNPAQQREGVARYSGRRLQVHTGDVRDTYKVLPIVIGTGSFGTVRSCIHRDTKTKLAIKSIGTKGKDKHHAELLKNEISLLQRVNHAHIVKVVDVIQDSQYIHIVMEQCRGGDLFDITLDDKTRLKENKVRTIIANLLDAIAYLHDEHIIHRDLKAEHLMFSGSDANSPIKIIDFGVACNHRPGDEPMTAFTGSLRSMAPEVIKRSYGRECDLWSTGIITYFLLMQQMPFDSPTSNQNEIFAKICSGKFYFPQWAATGISDEGKNFIDRMLVVDPRKRMTAREALSHPWIRNKKVSSKSREGKVAKSPGRDMGRQIVASSRDQRGRARSKSRNRFPHRSKSRTRHWQR